MKTVAPQFVEDLAAAGVKRIYGIVGDSLNGLADALRRQGKIEWVHVRHEEVAAFAAGAEAHVTGALAVCAGSCGPGNLHLINGLSIAIAHGCPYLPSPRTFLRPKSVVAISRRRIRKRRRWQDERHSRYLHVGERLCAAIGWTLAESTCQGRQHQQVENGR